MRDEYLTRLENLSDEATPGPWHVEPVGEDASNVCIKHAHFDVYRYESSVTRDDSSATVFPGSLSVVVANVACILTDRGIDATLMAKSRTAIPALLGEVRRLRASLGERDATIAALQQEIDELRVYSLRLANTLHNVTQEMEGEL